MTSPLLLLYRHFLAPLAIHILKKGRGRLSSKLQETIADRETRAFVPLPTKGPRPIWIHFSSGEYEYAKPVIRGLKRELPERPIIVTYMSPSVKKSLSKASDIDLWLPSPWDRPKDMVRFIEYYNPQLLLVARTDVWPEMAIQTRNHGIPSLLFSATLAENSTRMKRPGRYWASLAFHSLQSIYCVEQADYDNFSKLTDHRKVLVCGDTRYDQVRWRLEHPAPLKTNLRPRTDDELVLILGSTWPEDEAIWLEALPTLKQQYPKMQLMIAPHEPTDEHLEPLLNGLKEAGFASKKYSEAQEWKPAEALVIDQVGILADLYNWGNLAFIGGSFKHQVHSVMEPLAHGLHCLVGPLHQNNREALAFKQNHTNNSPYPIVTVIDSKEEILKSVEVLSEVWKDPRSKPSVASLVANKTGASVEILTWVKKVLAR